LHSEAHVKEVIAKCEALKAAGLWLKEPKIRPRAWINNFEIEDRPAAAFLLDKFTFYNTELTRKLLIASYNSLGDGLPKSPNAQSLEALLNSLTSAVLTPVKGENPNPTDSGYLICRMARQTLHIGEKHVTETNDALEHAYQGNTVIFIDDFVGSGDQFIKTWNRQTEGKSFRDAQARNNFTAIYITLIATDFGLKNINLRAPTVAVCATHVLNDKSTISGILSEHTNMRAPVENLLEKYSTRLTPNEEYMRIPEYRKYGYKMRGLLFGFEHSIPDATLPIFWSNGTNWEPLIERN